MPHHLRRIATVLAVLFAVAGFGSVAAASAGTSSPGTSASASPSTLINVPAARVCHYHRFTVGVWAQPGTSRANRRYVVNVYNPNWARVLHKSGHAPTSAWRLWHPTAWKLGRYHTSYKTWHNGVLYRGKYVTKSVRC